MENLVQALCRDMLAASMVQCEREGLPVVLHVHDELVCEVPGDRAGAALRRMGEIMSVSPAWAPDFPVRVEGYTGYHYTKSPFSDAHRIDMLGGRDVH